MIEKVTCRTCGHPAYRNSRGEILAHTTPATGGKTRGSGMSGWYGMPAMPSPSYVPARICEGSTRGARAK